MLYHGTGNGSASRSQLEAVLRPGGSDVGLGSTAKKLLGSQSRLVANNITLQAIFNETGGMLITPASCRKFL